MIYSLLADAVMTMHFAFTAFVLLGGVLVARWSRAGWVHLPALAYGIAIELFGWTCPLTPLESHLRQLAGGAGYEGSFLEHYLGPVLYPSHWESSHLWLAGGLVAVNLLAYAFVWRRRQTRSRQGIGPASNLRRGFGPRSS